MKTRPAIKFLARFHSLTDGVITLRLVEQNSGSREILPFYYFDIFDYSGFVGKISVRIGDNAHSYFNGHIGYEIDEAHRGNHYALRASRLVLPIAKAHGMRRLYLTCQESNAASRKTIERLDAVLLEVTDVPKSCFFWKPGIEKYCIYRLNLS